MKIKPGVQSRSRVRLTAIILTVDWEDKEVSLWKEGAKFFTLAKREGTVVAKFGDPPTARYRCRNSSTAQERKVQPGIGSWKPTDSFLDGHDICE